MSESKKGNSAKYLWKKTFFRGWLRISRSDIRMGDNRVDGDGPLYMQRLLFEFGERRRSIRLHVIHSADADNCLHDHPWAFWAFVLWGGYVEEIPHADHQNPDFIATFPEILEREARNGFPRRQEIVVKPFRLHRRPLNYKHRIVRLFKKVSVTLAYAGPLSQHWGFHTKDGKVIWENFVNEEQERRVAWCDVDA